MCSVVNNTEFRVIGMSRSGNHAIINWILKQLRGRYCFLNCAEPKSNPFVWARPLNHGPRHLANYDIDLEAEQRGLLTRKDYLLHSYEDCFLGTLCSPLAERHHDDWVGSSGQRVDILILRDPFNLFASRRKGGFGNATPYTAKRIWQQHAREFLGIRRYLGPDKVLISYNLWVTDVAYRRETARQLGLEFTDAGFGSVAAFAPGSSFDHHRYAHRAHEMKVLQRWRHFIEDPDYRDLFDANTVALSERIFGSNYELRDALFPEPQELHSHGGKLAAQGSAAPF